MAYFLYPLRILVGKLETTPGTMETLTDADFDIRIRNPEVTPTIELDDEASRWARGDHAEDDVITGAQSGQITFSVRMTKGTTSNTAPSWWKFANGCGLQSVNYTGKGYALQPRKAYDETTMTLWVMDIKRGANPTAIAYKFAGGMGNMVMTADGVGKPWMANFTFTGKLSSIATITNADILEKIIADTACAEKFINNDALLGIHSHKISSFSLDIGNEISPVIDQSDPSGYAFYGVTGRKPRLTMNPLMDSSHMIYNDIINGTTGCPTFYAGMVGSTGSDASHFSLHIPKAQIITANMGNREGLVSQELTIKCLGNGWTGAVSDKDLDPEVTWELLQGKRS